MQKKTVGNKQVKKKEKEGAICTPFPHHINVLPSSHVSGSGVGVWGRGGVGGGDAGEGVGEALTCPRDLTRMLFLCSFWCCGHARSVMLWVVSCLNSEGLSRVCYSVNVT